MRTKENGFTLIDTAIALILFGLILAPMLYQYQKRHEREELLEQFSKVSSFQEALKNYALINGRLPYPANPTLGTDDANFGVPVSSVPGSSECGASGTATNGVLCRPGVRTTAADAYHENVLIGTLPSSAIGVSPENALDRYGNQYTYAVTLSQTNTSQFQDNRGTIDVVSDQTGTSVGYGTDVNSAYADIQFVIVSHGELGIGAYNQQGARIACSGGSVAELENCDDDAVFADITQANDAGEENKVSPPSMIADDFSNVVGYESSVNSRLWTPKDSSWTTLTTGIDKQGKVAINRGATQNPRAQLDVEGDVRSEALSTARICNQDQNQCFLVKDLTDSSASSSKNLKCGSAGIGNVYVSSSNTSGEARGTCYTTPIVDPDSNMGVEDPLTGHICENGSKGVQRIVDDTTESGYRWELICKT